MHRDIRRAIGRHNKLVPQGPRILLEKLLVVSSVHNTPAFSDLVQPEPLITYSFAGDCQVPANTWKAEQSRAGIMG
jgi:hypothetical protein